MAKESSIVQRFAGQIHKHVGYITAIIIAMAISFSIYLLLDKDQAILLALEDGVFEYVTAACFFGTGVLTFFTFIRTKNYYYLVLSLVFFVGCGEEISWGQRIFGIDTPQTLAEKNMQGEINLHNLKVFHPQDELGSKSGLAKLITIDFLYNIFWLSWCIVVPFIALFTWAPGQWIKQLRIPVPELSVGFLFLVNFIVYILIRKSINVSDSELYYMKLREVFECVSAIIFIVVGYLLYKKSTLAPE